MRNLAFKLIIITLQTLVVSQSYANSGQFLCSPAETLIDGALSVGLGTLNYSGLNVPSLAQGSQPSHAAYYTLNFMSLPYTINAHHQRSLFQSGFQVFRSQELRFVNGAVGSHSGVTLYKTPDESGLWNIVSESQRSLRDDQLPSQLNEAARGKAYVIVGRRVGLIGFARRGLSLPKFSFCIKQSETNESFSESNIRLAFMQLMKDYNEKLKPKLSNRSEMIFSFNPDLHEPLEPRHRESVVSILSDLFARENYVFSSQYGNILSMGAYATTGTLLVLSLIRRGNVAAALLPPDIINQYLMIGKTLVITPEDEEITFEQIEDLFKNKTQEEIMVLMEEDPRLEAYLNHLTGFLYQQTVDPDGA